MSHDEDALDLLEDDGDGVNEMCLLFDKESTRREVQRDLLKEQGLLSCY